MDCSVDWKLHRQRCWEVLQDDQVNFMQCVTRIPKQGQQGIWTRNLDIWAEYVTLIQMYTKTGAFTKETN